MRVQHEADLGHDGGVRGDVRGWLRRLLIIQQRDVVEKAGDRAARQHRLRGVNGVPVRERAERGPNGGAGEAGVAH